MWGLIAKFIRGCQEVLEAIREPFDCLPLVVTERHLIDDKLSAMQDAMDYEEDRIWTMTKKGLAPHLHGVPNRYFVQVSPDNNLGLPSQFLVQCVPIIGACDTTVYLPPPVLECAQYVLNITTQYVHIRRTGNLWRIPGTDIRVFNIWELNVCYPKSIEAAA